jgi:hypothetical protein
MMPNGHSTDGEQPTGNSPTLIALPQQRIRPNSEYIAAGTVIAGELFHNLVVVPHLHLCCDFLALLLQLPLQVALLHLAAAALASVAGKIVQAASLHAT